ncbi:hypothetical protein HR51_26410 [Burkholderia cepacia]|nr:hypothetical protein HR51_26410 [Burkholderia cepacia]
MVIEGRRTATAGRSRVAVVGGIHPAHGDFSSNLDAVQDDEYVRERNAVRGKVADSCRTHPRCFFLASVFH